MKSIFINLALLFLAVLFFFAGTGMPLHFRAIDKSVLQEAGLGTPDLQDLAQRALDRAQPGPAVLILDTLDELEGSAPALRRHLESLFEADPLFRLTGGEDPFFETILSELGLNRDTRIDGDSSGVVNLVIPKPGREALLKELNQSNIATVETLLASREMNGTVVFQPVFTVAGAPLETAILLMALSVQSEFTQESLEQEIRQLSVLALQNDLDAIQDLETAYLAVLTLTQRLNWIQWGRILETVGNSEELASLARLWRTYPAYTSLFASALIMKGEAASLITYIDRYGDKALESMEFALSDRGGAGSLARLLNEQKILYQPPPLIVPLRTLLAPYTTHYGARLVSYYPELALVLKTAAYLLAGMFLLSLFIRLIHWAPLQVKSAENSGPGIYRRSLVWTGRLVAGIAFAAIAWAATEPELLDEGTQRRAELRFDLSFETPLGSIGSSPLIMSELDQVTLLVLGIFFFVQSIIYIFCLIKLAEIRKQPVPPELKIRLVENEEPLFDMGLYVGLGGTVLSLILVTLGIVEASLMAAYASTLFGILFVALLKIFHVRPLRKRFLIEQQGR